MRLNKIQTDRSPDAVSKYKAKEHSVARNEGFAIVIALSLMSVVLLMLVTLTALARVESQAAQIHQKNLLAKENARLGLMIALGNLQRYAGPDQRVTARAEILGEDNFHIKKSKWTGVWDDENKLLAWLGSGIDPISADLGNTDIAVKLVDETSAGAEEEQHVWAPLEELERGSKFLGSFAYYVSDESVKVSVGKKDVIANALDDPSSLGLEAIETKRLAQASAGRPRTEIIFPELQTLLATDRTRQVWVENEENSIASRVEKSASAWNFDLIEEFQLNSANEAAGSTSYSADVLEANYHNLTFLSKGLLVDTKQGGLKRDLSDDTVSDPLAPFALNKSLFDFLNNRVNDEDHASFQGIEMTVSNNGESENSEIIIKDGKGVEIKQGDPINLTPTVLTEFGLYLGVFRTDRYENTLEVSLAFKADFWNPYATSLGFNPRGQEDFTIAVQNLPIITVNWETGRGSAKPNSGSFDLDLSELEFANEAEERFTIANIPYDIYDKMSVGEVRNTSERQITATIPGIEIVDEGNRARSSDDFISLEAPDAKLVITLNEIPANTSTKARTVQRFDNIEFKAYKTDDIRYYNLRAEANPSYNSDFLVVYHFKFEDDVMAGDLEAWSSQLDPRLAWMDFSEPNAAQMIYVNEEPSFAAVDNTKFMGRPEFFTSRNYHRFFDYPARPVVSVGFLQHLSFYKDPPFSIGNSWGGSKNAVFDRYFFSGYGEGVNSSAHVNPHLGISDFNDSVDPTNGQTAAARYHVNGAFNLNSTSVEAWKTALSGINLYDWTYRMFETRSAITRPFVQNAVFRFSHHADRTYKHPYTDNIDNYPEISQQQRGNWYRKEWQPDWAAAFTTGMRELRGGYDNKNLYANENDVIDDVSELAEAIVALLKQRGEPYASIEDLLTEGVDPASGASQPLLQEAIDMTRINTVSQNNYKNSNNFLERFPRYSPSFVTQADLISVLAPYSQVRGDTFVIRAAGRVAGITEGSSSTKYCEAVIQRKVSPVANSVASSPSTPGVFGRQFEIIDFRWLDAEEI